MACQLTSLTDFAFEAIKLVKHVHATSIAITMETTHTLYVHCDYWFAALPVLWSGYPVAITQLPRPGLENGVEKPRFFRFL